MRPSTIIPILVWLPVVAFFAWLIPTCNHLSKGEFGIIALIVSLPAAMLHTFLSMRLHGRRRQLLADQLAELGFTPLPDHEARALHYTPEGNHHSFQLHFALTANWRGQKIHLAEYDYDIGHGRGRITFTMTEVAAEVPTGTPCFELRPPFSGRSFRLTFRSRSIINDKRFDRRWQLRTEDPDAVRDLLTPDLVNLLGHAPSREHAWKSDGRWLSCTIRRACYPRDIEPVLGRLAAIANRSVANAPRPAVAL